jgi:hypothetical protein
MKYIRAILKHIGLVKYIGCFFWLASALAGYSQTAETLIKIPTTPSPAPVRPALLYLPRDYRSTTGSHPSASGAHQSSTGSYPLLVFLHGSGEAGTDPSRIYNNAAAGGPAYLIEHGGWPASFSNPADGRSFQFIVLSPQSDNGWSSSGDETDYMIRYMTAHYRVDTNRIYLTGISAGGGGIIEYAAHLNNKEDAPAGDNDHVRRWKAAAIVPLSAATNIPRQSWADLIVKDGIKVWGYGDPDKDTYGEFTMKGVSQVNHAKAGWGIFTPGNQGHGGWAGMYDPSFRQTINGVSMNIYEWMLTNTR